MKPYSIPPTTHDKPLPGFSHSRAQFEALVDSALNHAKRLGATDAAGTECEIEAYRDVATELGLKIVNLRDDVCPSYPTDCDRIHRYDGLHYDGDEARTVAGIILDAV